MADLDNRLAELDLPGEALRNIPPGRGRKILVAMSGGVDSSVAAALLVRAGYEVVGCFMRLGSPGESLDGLGPIDGVGSESAGVGGAGVACEAGRGGGPGSAGRGAKIKIGHQGCCSINDAADARLVAAELGVPFYVCNFKKDFARIIDYFVDEYERGRTPNPCVRCNDWLKFGKLHEYARQIGAEFVASGHYARIERGRPVGRAGGGTPGGPPGPAPVPPPGPTPGPPPGPRLLRGVDSTKDQSYVLFGARREQLAEMLLPIGELEKPVVRELAERLGLPVFDKPDSQEICFVPDNDYAGLVERRSERARSAAAAGGAILGPDGEVLGRHAGQHRFTVGQRRGHGVAVGRPLYVVAKNAEANTITLGDRDELLAGGCVAGSGNWLVEPPVVSAWRPCLAQHRYNGTARPARVRRLPPEALDGRAGPPGPTGDGSDDRTGRGDEVLEVRFDEPESAVTPGQAVVLYDRGNPDLVLGGGWISRVVGRS